MEEKTLRFGLHSIKQKSSYLNSLDSLNISDFDITTVGVGKGYNLDFDQETGLFTILSTIDFIYRRDKESKEILKLFGVKVEVQFHLQDFDGIISKLNDNKINAPDPLIVNLISITYSTVRGILFSLTSKSDYEGLYLPLTAPAEFKRALIIPD